MNFSAFFIHRPVATTLLTLGIFLAGLLGFRLLPVAPLPQVDFPTISVQAALPGASPETMAATVATPLERSLGRIAGVTEITSSSTLGNTRITLQFDLDRDINGAGRDVQGAIAAARSLLPTGMPGNPTWRKMNPADAPILILALTSKTLSQGRIYDAASTILAQKLSQVDGVGQVRVGGSSLPAVRVELNPLALHKYGIGLEDVRVALATANANRPKGDLEEGDRHWQITATDQATKAADYLPLIVSFRNGSPVRVSDVAEQVVDSVEDLRNAGLSDSRPAVLVIVYRQPGANIIETVDRVKAVLPQMRASLPGAMDVEVAMDRTPTIRASLHDVELTLLISIALVIAVVFLFLRNARATLIPGLALAVSLVGTFAAMYLCDYSLDNLSLMALTVATGFVVDDAIVVLENTTRHLEAGDPPFTAALKGAREVSFTVLSMSLSLVAVFIPILFMGGIIGRLFREFAVVLTVAILISLVLSLTTTPMLCARVLKAQSGTPGRLYQWSERGFNALLSGYSRSLAWALDHGRFMMLLLLATVCVNIWLYTVVPKGFFPQQDTGRLSGSIQADQGISFQAMKKKLSDFMEIVRGDPAVDNVVGFTGGGQRNSGFMFVALKPLSERKVSADQVIGRLRGKISKEPGASLYLQPVQDIRMGGRAGSAQWQYTLQADELAELREWEPRVRKALSELPELKDVNTDQQDKGLSTLVTLDRDTASRLGVTPRLLDATLNDAFGQRQVSTIYAPLNQYHVVMEAAPRYWQSADALDQIWLSVPGNPTPTQVPLSAVARYGPSTQPLAVNHQGQFAASTISFNLAPGISLSDATRVIDGAMAREGVPIGIHGNFQGTARAFKDSLASQPVLILTALITLYIVLGVLYESTVHPITILSTLPSAGVGALLALMATGTDFSIMALIGVLLLIGIVKKNAIMMVDFALDAERKEGLPPMDAIFRACQLRFRPIMMTTLAALLGALPLALALGGGEGSELRRPLGISIVGGLMLSQLLTLYTTPVVYLYLDRFRLWAKRGRPDAFQPAENGI
jgi:multidrug efflux pump